MSQTENKIDYYEGYIYKVVVNSPDGADEEFLFVIPINEREKLWEFILQIMNDYYEDDGIYSIVFIEELHRYKTSFILC